MKAKVKYRNVTFFDVAIDSFIIDHSDIAEFHSGKVLCTIIDSASVLEVNSNRIILDSLNRSKTINGFEFLQDRILRFQPPYLLVYSKSPQRYALLDCKKNCIISDTHQFGKYIFNEYIVDGVGDSEFIKVRSILINKEILKFNLSDLNNWLDGNIEKPYQVSEFCGIHENTLVCTLNSGAILLLDIHSGDVKRFLPDAKFPRQLYAKKGAPHIYVGLFSQRYIEVDVLKGEIIKDISIESQLKAIKGISEGDRCWFSVGFSILYDDKIYFLAETNFVGVFDPASEKIVDFHEFEFDKSKGQQLRGGKENLQVREGKIYCLDTLGNLYELQSDKIGAKNLT